jgi:hypothetical protein
MDAVRCHSRAQSALFHFKTSRKADSYSFTVLKSAHAIDVVGPGILEME